jgi:hypothetical protein
VTKFLIQNNFSNINSSTVPGASEDNNVDYVRSADSHVPG